MPGTHRNPGNLESATCRIQRRRKSPNPTISASYNCFIINDLRPSEVGRAARQVARETEGLERGAANAHESASTPGCCWKRVSCTQWDLEQTGSPRWSGDAILTDNSKRASSAPRRQITQRARGSSVSLRPSATDLCRQRRSHVQADCHAFSVEASPPSALSRALRFPHSVWSSGIARSSSVA